MLRRSRILFLFIVLSAPAIAQADKAALNAAVDAHLEAAWQDALKIWDWAEPGYHEVKSSALIAGTLEAAAFEVKRGVAEIPTAFVATIGSGKPVIGILGEFDALPGLSQEAVPLRQPRPGNTYGQACGHHLFGAGSMLAALALADRVKAGDLACTIRYYGTPAEEGGAAKVFMVRAGLFNDCDVVLHWHPGDRNTVGDPTNLARISAKFRFHGKAAHAAGAPEQGRSALGAVELMAHASELLREHTPDYTRIHHIITAGGDAPNVVPAFSEIYYYVRHPDVAEVQDLYRRLLLCAQAGALATETQLEVENLGGTYNILPNDALTEVMARNLHEVANIAYTPDELRFAEQIQKTLDNPGDLASVARVSEREAGISKGSTDVGDVSWVTPTAGFRAACWVPGTPAHTWQAAAAGGTTIGRKGMELAAHVLAATAWDLAHEPQTVARAKRELALRTGQRHYAPLLEAGQKPPLDYRDAPEEH